MKKSAKPVIFYSIICIAVFGGIILVNVMTKLNCDKYIKDISVAQEVVEAKKNTQIKLQAELQNWCSEEKIPVVAESDLNMIKMTNKAVIMEVEKSKIEQVEKAMSANNE